MKFTKKYVLVPIDRYNSMKKLQVDKSEKEDLDSSPELAPHKSKYKHRVEVKSKVRQPLPTSARPPKPPPGIRTIKQKKQSAKTESRAVNSRNLYSNIKWRPI